MKQELKTKRTRERILAAAIAEFGTKRYDTASVNAICSESQISKGLLYHNFKNKDELYLQCVKACFDSMTGYLKGQALDFENVQEGLGKLLSYRQTFFLENPLYQNIFFNVLLQPPKHLLPEIQEIRREFDAFHTACYRRVLQILPLREGITEELALEYFAMFQESFNGYFQRRAEEANDYQAFIADHEGKLSEFLNIMLYGIVAP